MRNILIGSMIAFLGFSFLNLDVMALISFAVAAYYVYEYRIGSFQLGKKYEGYVGILFGGAVIFQLLTMDWFFAILLTLPLTLYFFGLETKLFRKVKNTTENVKRNFNKND